MSRRASTMLTFVLLLCTVVALLQTGHASAAAIEVGDKVVTIAQAPLQLQGKVLATIEPGTELSVIRVSGEWIGVSVVRQDKTLSGWLAVKSVKPAGAPPDSQTPALHLTTNEEPVGKFLEVGIVRGSITVSPDNRRIAYAAVRDGMVAVVVDQKPGKAYEGVAGITFSPDSKRLAYAAVADGKWTAVVDGTESKAYDGIGDGTPVFSPDSTRVAFVAESGDQRFLVVDGAAGKPYDTIAGSTVTFGPDGKHVAYVAGHEGKWFVVVDGTEGEPCDGFLGASKLVFDSPTSLNILADRGGEFFRTTIKISNQP